MRDNITYSLTEKRAHLKAKDGHAFMDFGVSGSVIEILDSKKHTSTKNVSSLLLQRIVSQLPGVGIIRGELAETNLQKYRAGTTQQKEGNDLLISIPICRACLENGFTDINFQRKGGKIFFKARKASNSGQIPSHQAKRDKK